MGFSNLIKALFNNSSDVSYQQDKHTKALDKYFSLLDQQPNYEKVIGRSFNNKKYTDKYDTGTPYSLRQLLLLVWLGKVKRGRLVTASVPQYFFYDYNINGKDLINHFLNSGLISVKNDRYVLSDSAKELTKKYASLWDMHRLKGFPLCLDDDFTGLENGTLLKELYSKEIKYYQLDIQFETKLLDFYLSTPEYFESQDNQQHEIESQKQFIQNSKSKLADLQEKYQLLNNIWSNN